MGILFQINGFGRFHLRPVPDHIKIPGHEPNIYPLPRKSIHHLVDTSFQPDGVVQIDLAPAFHPEQGLYFHGFGKRIAHALVTEPFLEGGYPKGTVDAFMIG